MADTSTLIASSASNSLRRLLRNSANGAGFTDLHVLDSTQALPQECWYVGAVPLAKFASFAG